MSPLTGLRDLLPGGMAEIMKGENVKMRRTITLLVAAVMAMVCVTAPASASATPSFYWIVKSKWAGYNCLDQNSTDGVHTRVCNGGLWQLWVVEHYSDGTVRLMNEGTDLCLDNSEYGVRAWGCNNLSYQRWKVNYWGNGESEFVSQWNNHCLDRSEYGVRTVGCNGLNYQRWWHTETP